MKFNIQWWIKCENDSFRKLWAKLNTKQMVNSLKSEREITWRRVCLVRITQESLGNHRCPPAALDSPLSWGSSTCNMNLLLFPEEVAEVAKTHRDQEVISCGPRALCFCRLRIFFFQFQMVDTNLKKQTISWHRHLWNANVSAHS